MKPKCALSNCESVVTARGWCNKHYQRWLKYGDAEWLPECRSCGSKYEPPNSAKRYCADCLERGCAIDGCNDPIWSRGWCGTHYSRWRDYGDPEYIAERKCADCGGTFLIPPGVGRGNGAALYCEDCSGRVAHERRNAESIKAYRRAWRKRNRAATRAAKRAWYEKNRDHAIAYAKQYAKDNPDRRQAWMDANRATVRQWSQRRRARLRENGVYLVSARDLDRLMRVHGSACVYCAVPLSDKTLTWDHVIPIARGGCHSVGNLVPACKSCNSSKRDRTVMEFRMLLTRMAVAA